MIRLINTIVIFSFITFAVIEMWQKKYPEATFDMTFAILYVAFEIQDDIKELKNGN